MKIKGHQTFHIRRGWIHKGIKLVNNNEDIFSDKNICLTDIFGIGSNMVVSLKYWLEALKLIEKVKNGAKIKYKLTEIGQIILKNDPYLEESKTWQLLHHNLVTNKELATTWYWFFNEYDGNIFNKDNLINNLNNYFAINYNKEVSLRSIKDDISCLINTYFDKKLLVPEDNIESPFAQLNLIEYHNKKNGDVNYMKKSCTTVDANIIYYIISNIANGRKNLDLKEILNNKNSIGRIYNLDIYEIVNRLDCLQNLGYIRLVRTGGLDYITFVENIENKDILQKLYD